MERDSTAFSYVLTGAGIILILALFLSALGCATPTWTKPDVTQADFDRDRFDCEQRVVTMYGGYANMGIGHAVYARQDMFRCMEGKGYRQVATP